MFIYIILRDNKNNPMYVDKLICSEACYVCPGRFLCYTREWNTFRSKDDIGVIFEEDEVPWATMLNYRYRLVTTEYDKIIGGIS